MKLFLFLTINAFVHHCYGMWNFATNIDIASKTIGRIKIYLSTIISPVHLSKNCTSDFLALQTNVLNGESNWGWRMLDATSKLQSGILSLNLADFGNFQQCTNVKAHRTEDNDNNNLRTILGKYCLGSIKTRLTSDTSQNKYMQLFDHSILTQIAGDDAILYPNITQTLDAFENNPSIQGPTWAICIPDSCSAKDAESLINYGINYFVPDLPVNVSFSDLFCQTINDINTQYTPGAIIVITILTLYAVFLLVCSLYDAQIQHQGKEINKVLKAFSIYTNLPNLLNITKRVNPQKISCLDGLKFLSMLWVVLGHQFSVTSSGPILNSINLIEWANSVFSMFLVNGTMSVDTFLVIGASLNTYIYLNSIKKGIKIPILSFYLHRYIRLTPPLAAAVLISATLLVYMGSGPRWPLMYPYFQKNCADYWWTTLLYVQNYANTENMCVGQTWYLSIDMQMTIISPFLFYLLLKFGNKGVWFIALLGISCMAFSFHAAWSHKLTALLSNPYGNTIDYSNYYYLLTHTRATPWFIGSILGYYIHLNSTGMIKLNIKEKLYNSLWLLSFATLFFCIFIGHKELRTIKYNQWGNALHLAFIRPLWSIGISAIIFTCVFDKKGVITKIVNGFLSLRIWEILARFTYSVYLTHVTLLYVIAFGRKSPEVFTPLELLQKYCGTLIFSMVLALIWVLAFESPTLVLEKIFFSGEKIIKPSATEEIEEEERIIEESAPNTSRQTTLIPMRHLNKNKRKRISKEKVISTRNPEENTLDETYEELGRVIEEKDQEEQKEYEETTQETQI